MKITVHIIRIVVGLLFIFSGLVKANDPLGLSYKMQEFFEIWGMHRFNGWSLILSVLMNGFEIIAGFALLTGWRIGLFSRLLFILILFFTFLTGYTYVTGKPVNCGCFGDCLPITSKTSFLKDVILTLLIGFLYFKQKLIKPLFTETGVTAFMFVITVFSFGFQVVDCLPFKKGNNITEKMKMPANAIPDSTVITFVYSKAGKELEFTADKFPTDFNKDTYTFVRRYDKIIKKGKNNEPPIKGFVLSGETNTDSTGFVLEQPFAVLLFIEKFEKAGNTWKERFEEIYKTAKAKNIPAFLITAESGISSSQFSNSGFADITVFKCDYKAIQTAARSNPCIYLIKQGTVQNKYSGRNLKNIIKDLEIIPAQAPPKIDQAPVVQPADSTVLQN
jgi:uncharacterized membrane protein YphA (DoxX/SURF4 family)